MQFDYKTARVDVTPLVTATGFQARAKLLRKGGEGESSRDEQYARDLGIFSTSREAVEHARRWAIEFCDKNWS